MILADEYPHLHDCLMRAVVMGRGTIAVRPGGARRVVHSRDGADATQVVPSSCDHVHPEAIAAFAGVARRTVEVRGRLVILTREAVEGGIGIRVDDPDRYAATPLDLDCADAWIGRVSTVAGLHVVCGGQGSGRRTTLAATAARLIAAGTHVVFLPSSGTAPGWRAGDALVAGRLGTFPLAYAVEAARRTPVMISAASRDVADARARIAAAGGREAARLLRTVLFQELSIGPSGRPVVRAEMADGEFQAA